MNVSDWLMAAHADARRRGLDGLLPLLDNVARTMEVLRASSWEDGTGAGTGPAQHIRQASAVTAAPAAVATDASAPPATTGTDVIAPTAVRLARGDVRAERLVEDCLATVASLNPRLNAFVSVTADAALAAAREADREIAAGRIRGPLHGIPIAVKDIVDLAGVPTTASSNVRGREPASADATVTARLRAAGAVFVGKTNLHEFALGTTTEESAFGPSRHPMDASRSPGGSSGGSAIAVATGMALGAVGTDTGGSIRIPAAACGIVGLKPQWNEIPADGVVPLSRQLDHVGPMTRSIRDAWLMYEVMCGRTVPNGERLAATPVAGLRIGVPRGYLFDRLDSGVETTVWSALDRLRRAGATVADVELPHIADTPHVYLLLAIADAAEYHARSLERQPGDYTEPVRLRLEMGRYMMAEDYVRAQRGRAALAGGVDRVLGEFDLLALPALAIPAPPIGAANVPVKGGVEPVRAAMLRCTQAFNMTGHPAIALPCGVTPEGLPVGLQLVGRRDGTRRLLEAALGIEGVLAPA